MAELFEKDKNTIMKNLVLPYLEFKDLTVLARVSSNMYSVYLQYFQVRKAQIIQYIRDINFVFGDQNLEDPVVHFLTVFKPELMQKHFAYVGDRLYAFRDTDYAYQVFQHMFDLWVAGTPLLLDKLPDFDYDAHIAKENKDKNFICTYTRKKIIIFSEKYYYYLKTSIPCNNEISIFKSQINLDYLYFNKDFKSLTFYNCNVLGNVNPDNIKFFDNQSYEICLRYCEIENPDFINHFRGAYDICLDQKPINFNQYTDFTSVDFREFKNLKELSIEYAKINIDGFMNLEALYMEHCHLNRVNWNSISNINNVLLKDCDITDVDIELTNDSKLKKLNLNGNKITKLKIRGQGKISLELDHNLLTELDLSNIHIKDFSCKYNHLHKINMNTSQEMNSVRLSNNNLNYVASFNSKNVDLGNNNLTKYKVHSNTEQLNISNNALTNLEVQYNHQLSLDAKLNKNLKYISLTKPAIMNDINPSFNKITLIDLPPNVSKVNLFNNKIKAIEEVKY